MTLSQLKASIKSVRLESGSSNRLSTDCSGEGYTPLNFNLLICTVKEFYLFSSLISLG